MMTLTLKERTEKRALSFGNGNGSTTAQSPMLTGTVYRTGDASVKQLMELAVELARIEIALKKQQRWLHPQPCTCEQCSAVFAEILALARARQAMLAEIAKLEAAADADEIECVRCSQPFRPTMGDERVCDACWLAESGPRR